jgi:glycosyltransferase involved in cell wall biosynthesis
MRVLHIGKFFPPYPGGIERYCAELATAQAAQGVTTALLAHAPPGTWRKQDLRVDNVDVTLAACWGQWLYAPISPGLPFLLARKLREFRPDLLHLHMPNTSAFWALLSPSARRVPWIVHWHADIPLDTRKRGLRAAYRLYRPWEQALLKRARAIIVTSAPYFEASEALRPWREKVQVIPLGIAPEPSALSPQASGLWPSSGLRILAVGRLSYYKGFDVLLRALVQVPHAQLVLVGTGECDSALRALATELRIAERVCFAGHVDDATLAHAYAEADLFCLPSIDRAEAFGLVLLEAMRAGRPVVASAIPGSGVGFVVAQDCTGLLVPPGDASALAAAIQRIAGETGLREQFGAAGRQRWRDEFTLERSAQQVLGLYRRILDASRDRVTAASGT